jgi:hypothetical protein
VERMVAGYPKKGLIWHFQGSSKSLLMVFAAKKLRMRAMLKNPTVLILADNIEQLRRSDIRKGATAQIGEDVILKACIHAPPMTVSFGIDVRLEPFSGNNFKAVGGLTRPGAF